jgi:hypothetical protein
MTETTAVTRVFSVIQTMGFTMDRTGSVLLVWTYEDELGCAQISYAALTLRRYTWKSVTTSPRSLYN